MCPSLCQFYTILFEQSVVKSLLSKSVNLGEIILVLYIDNEYQNFFYLFNIHWERIVLMILSKSVILSQIKLNIFGLV